MRKPLFTALITLFLVFNFELFAQTVDKTPQTINEWNISLEGLKKLKFKTDLCLVELKNYYTVSKVNEISDQKLIIEQYKKDFKKRLWISTGIGIASGVAYTLLNSNVLNDSNNSSSNFFIGGTLAIGIPLTSFLGYKKQLRRLDQAIPVYDFSDVQNEGWVTTPIQKEFIIEDYRMTLAQISETFSEIQSLEHLFGNQETRMKNKSKVDAFYQNLISLYIKLKLLNDRSLRSDLLKSNAMNNRFSDHVKKLEKELELIL